MSSSAPITLLWRRTTLDRVPESWFIEHILFAGLGRPLRTLAVEKLIDAPFQDDIVIVSLTTEFAPYLAEARRRGMRRIVLLHLGDELMRNDRSFYAHADLVLRNYWSADVVDDSHVHWVPNGYAIGVGPAGLLIPASARSIPGFYAGALSMRALSDERRRMRDVTEQNLLPFRLHWTATARDRLGPAAYAATLRDAQFALVPGGNSPETIRLYDALENGAIPIMLRSAFVDAVGALDHPPLLLLDDWDELPAAYQAAAEGDVDALQARTQEWWQEFKTLQQSRVAKLVKAVME